MKVTHYNSQGEKITIEERKLDGKPVHCLVIYDDAPPRGTGQPAPILLDKSTRAWLRASIEMVELDAIEVA